MAPCYEYLCHSCMYTFDRIESYDSPSTVNCPRCEEKKCAHRLPSLTSTPRGSFGTVPRYGKDKPAKFNFVEEKPADPVDEEEKELDFSQKGK